MENAIRSEAWRLDSFTDHVFAASAVGEAVGVSLGLLLFLKYKKSSLLGHPLLNVSSSTSISIFDFYKSFIGERAFAPEVYVDL